MLELAEQFALPETSPPMLARLLEAIERKGERVGATLTRGEVSADAAENYVVISPE